MIELKELTPDERTLITIGCEPFFISFKENTVLRPVYNELIKIFPVNHKKEVWVFVTAAASALRHSLTGSMFSLRKDNYTKANKETGLNISYVKCKRVVETLHEKGFITMYKGFYDHEKSLSVKSCFIINTKLHDLFKSVNIKRISGTIPKSSLVELIDSSTKEPLSDLSKLQGINSKRELVLKYNKSLKMFDIRCKIHKVSAVYKRVFTDNLNSHGRWYSLGCLQTTRSELREFITIDGVKTTEVDFRQMHPRILYELEGIKKPYDWEPYCDITDLFSQHCCKRECRLLSKMAMMCLLNAEDLNAAKSALWKIYSKTNKEDFLSIKMYDGCINLIFQRLIDKNYEISHWFGKEKLWALLQYYDSEIAANIIERFMDLGKCILPWHDSFVVKVEDRGFLMECMMDSWNKVLNSNNNCFYDVEF